MEHAHRLLQIPIVQPNAAAEALTDAAAAAPDPATTTLEVQGTPVALRIENALLGQSEFLAPPHNDKHLERVWAAYVAVAFEPVLRFGCCCHGGYLNSEL